MAKLFVVSAPSGCGKTTVVNAVVDRLNMEYSLERVVTYTTKKPRAGEVDGIDYHFLSVEKFQKKIEKNFFLEWSTAYQDFYGSPRCILNDVQGGSPYIMIVDLPGVRSIKKINHKDVVFIWLYPRDFSILKERLVKRNTESLQEIEHRLNLAEKELEEESNEQLFDHYIINDELESAVSSLEKLVKAALK